MVATTRTRTHTPAAPATENLLIGKKKGNEGFITFTHTSLQEHDAAIRKAERERVLDKLIALHAGRYYDKGKDEHQSWVDSIESLRGGGAP